MMTQMFDKWIEEREDPRKSAAVAEGKTERVGGRKSMKLISPSYFSGLFEMKLSELIERKQEIEM